MMNSPISRAPKGKPMPGPDRRVSAVEVGQTKTLTRLRSDADKLLAADEDMALLPAARRKAAAAAVTSARATGKTVAAAQSRPTGSSKRRTSQAHLTITRVEPWSVMKFAFVVSLFAFVILLVTVSIVYGALSALGVFDSVRHFVSSITSSQTSAGINATAWFSASRVLGCIALLGLLNVVLITALSTIGAVVYNLICRLTGGVAVTLRETE